MDGKPTEFSILCQPHSVDLTDYALAMGKQESRKVLAENVRKLAQKEWGDKHISKLANKTGITPGGATRILGAKNVGPDLIDKVARYFKVETWMLFVPSFDPDSKPALMASTHKEAYQKLVDAAKELGALASDEEPITANKSLGKKG